MLISHIWREKQSWLCFCLMLILDGCSSPKKVSTAHHDLQLKFLDEYVIPFGMKFDNTTVGGLSGIDYDANTQLFASICDDRSDINPARYYSYQIQLQKDKIDTVIFREMYFLKNAQNRLFPPLKSDKEHSVDPEALRFFESDKIIWSDEGLRQVQPNDTVLISPRVFLSSRNGNFIDTFQLPYQFNMNAGESGPRNNGGFEGLAISPDKKYVWVSTEEPLINDGPRAGINDSSGVVRIIKFDINTKREVAQFAYRIDPVAHPVSPTSGFRVNGISDILFLDNDHLLVIERSFSTGRLTCTIKVYIADITNGYDISNITSLKDAAVRVLPKKLLLNMDSLGMFIDNIEGVTFGPRLSNGNQSLIFIADNNFNFFEKSQLLHFELSQ